MSNLIDLLCFTKENIFEIFHIADKIQKGEFKNFLNGKSMVLFFLSTSLRKITEKFFLRAKRIEIPASITAVEFYKKMGYDYKNGIAEIDDEQVYRLEKFR